MIKNYACTHIRLLWHWCGSWEFKTNFQGLWAIILKQEQVNKNSQDAIRTLLPGKHVLTTQCVAWQYLILFSNVQFALLFAKVRTLNYWIHHISDNFHWVILFITTIQPLGLHQAWWINMINMCSYIYTQHQSKVWTLLLIPGFFFFYFVE